MNTLYILGAGSSKNYDQGVSPVPNLEVPINRDFFVNAKKIIDYYDLSNMFGPIVGLDHFIRNINRLFGYGDSEDDTTSFLDPRLSLEEIMVHFSLKKDILRYDNEYFSGNARTDTLNELLAYTLAESLSGGLCRKHQRFAQRITSSDVVWNFNYDILMDNALYAESKFADSGYVMRFDFVYDNGIFGKPNDGQSEVTMLKLHGSLNWLQCHRCGSNLLLRSTKDVPALWTGVRNLEINCPKCGATKYDGLKRNIIPPSVKTFSDIEIKYLWKRASNFSNIENIVSVGYSFSENDPQVKMLLMEMKQGNSFISKVPISVVTHTENSYKKIKSRIQPIFPESPIVFEPASSFFQ